MKERSFLSKSIFLVLCVAAMALLGSLILAGFIASTGVEDENITSIIEILDNGNEHIVKLGIAINHVLLFAGSALLFCRFVLQKKVGAYFKFKPHSDLETVGLLFLLLVCAYPIIAASGMLFEDITLPEWLRSADDSSMEHLTKLLEMNSLTDYLINLLLIAIIPAIGEELLFRGVIQQEIIKKIRKPIIGIFITALLFAAVHLQIEGFPPKFLIGLILGYAYYTTQNIWIPIALHFFNNGLLVTAHFLMSDSIQAESMSDTDSPSIFMIIFSLCLCAFIVSIIARKTNDLESIA